MSDQPELEAPRPLSFFIPGLNGGGAQRVFVTLVNTLVDMTNHPIHLITSREGGAFEGLVDERVVRVVLGKERVSRSIMPLARYIRAERPAAMISTLDYCNVAFLLAASFARVPVRKVVREANVIPDQFGSPWDKSKSLGLRFLMRFLYPRADHIIIITKDVERSLLRHRIGSVRQMRQIPNPVIVDRTRQRGPAKVVSSFILAIGRLVYQKGFDVLIRAFASLPNRELKLVILGTGPLQKDLKLLASELGVADRVLFPGFVENTEDYLQEAALFVLSSRWEGFSNVLMEALAVGTPVVACDCPGSPREVLEGGRLGRLVPVDDAAALARVILKELSSPSCSREARILRAQCYEPEIIASRYLDALTQS